MRYIEKHPMIMIVIGILGISLSSILVKYSAAPSAITAAFRLLWCIIVVIALTVLLFTVLFSLISVPPFLLFLSHRTRGAFSAPRIRLD